MARSTHRCTWLLSFALIGCVAPLYAQTDVQPTVSFSGDFRLRYENTSNQELPIPGAPGLNNARNRGVVRFRGGATVKINGLLEFGGRLATGSIGDPNTTDATLGDFVDDLEVNLDKVYLALRYQDVFFTGGKFGNPFLRTDLVWDGDVNPQGLAAGYTFSELGAVTPKFTGIYSIVDEQTFGPDSYMWGGQAQFAFHPAPNWRITLSGGYYDYRIGTLSNADAGDTRSNNLNADRTAYLSDFDLLDAIAVVEYGASEHYPVRFVGDYVKNLGAAADDDTGIMLDLYVGRASAKNDRRFQYGYSQTETDAVLAAFSNDNTTLATNYVQHTLAFDFVPIQQTTLNLTWYIFRRKDFAVAPAAENEWISRLRLNAMVSF